MMNEPGGGHYFVVPPGLQHALEQVGQAHRMTHVADDAAKQLSKVSNVEFEIEVTHIGLRAREFDYLLESQDCTLEQAAGGWVRHMAADRVAKLAVEYAVEPNERAEYEAQSLEHQAAVLRWMTKMTKIIELAARLDKARAGGEAQP